MGSYFFGFIGFLKVMGVEYESYWAIYLFLFFIFVFGFIAFFKDTHFFNEECQTE
ncbi:hypothetical protein [Priestia megaterium]